MVSEDCDEHVIEAIGRCRVVIRNGEVVEVGEPQIGDCPLAKRFAVPVKEFSKEAIQANIEHRIRAFGMCTPRREVLADEDFVGFGASELLSSAMRGGLIDAAVLASDGAGTVVVTTPRMIQGIGGRMSGLVSTTPLREVMDRIEKHGGFVLDHATAKLDQPAGVRLAVKKGFHRIAVTVAGAETAEIIRRENPDALIFVVHTSGLSADEARRLAATADLVTGCASKNVREIIGPRALLQAGAAIPIFALTVRGKEVIARRIVESAATIFLKGEKLPVVGSGQPGPLI
ncbi:MAG TPA: methanogenesis marker 8 protein [Methanoregula sp.]|nr:methanogenesis marker 8 protein [Methanoregula sp.]